MKKLLLFLVMLFFIGKAGAQTFYTENSAMGDSSMKSGSSGNIAVFNMLYAASGSVGVRWNLTGSSSNLSATASPNMWLLGGVCDNITCRAASDVLNGTRFTTTYTTVHEDFHAILNADNAPLNSSAWVQVLIRDTASGYSRTLTLIATKTPLGVTTTVRNEESIRVYPNPARESVNVVFENSDIKTIGVYNMLGQPVSMFHVMGNSANLPLGDAPDGVYFLRMYDAQGKIVATRRFTRQ